jgi:hypothetical protein
MNFRICFAWKLTAQEVLRREKQGTMWGREEALINPNDDECVMLRGHFDVQSRSPASFMRCCGMCYIYLVRPIYRVEQCTRQWIFQFACMASRIYGSARLRNEISPGSVHSILGGPCVCAPLSSHIHKSCEISAVPLLCTAKIAARGETF